MLTRKQTKKRQQELISATRISNYIKNDMIIDFLDIIGEHGYTVGDDLAIIKKRKFSLGQDDLDLVKDNKKSKTSFDHIVMSGYNFEADIFKQIEIMMEENNEKHKLIKIMEPNINLNTIQTVQTIIKNTHDIILGSVVLNNKNNTWGKPDILAKGLWIRKYIKDVLVMVEDSKWYVIDVKSSTINLINGGEDISSKLLYNVYKSQVYIYTQALNNLLQEYNFSNNVSHGFILGKKYKYILNKTTIVKKPFESLGLIDFNKDGLNGLCWEDIISKSIEWIRDLRANWRSIKLNPINRDEIYPNMTNPYDKNYHAIKKQIAIFNKEITLLWYCGIPNRNLAWAKGIKKYDDPELNASVLGFANTNKELIIDSMLKLLHSNSTYILDKKNNFMEWQNKSEFEFYIDFETFCTDSIYDAFGSNFESSMLSNQVIYMIGVSWVNLEKKLSHKCFIIDYTNSNQLEIEFKKNKQFDNVTYSDCIKCTNELDLINQFYNWFISFKPDMMNLENYRKNTRLYHWSGAEPIIFNKKISEYGLDINKFNLNWFDLLKVFKHDKYPIIIKECFNFGLKEVVKKLNSHGEINLSWSDLDDGLLSSFIARDIYNNTDSESNQNMYFIIEYNYIDCKALFELLNWMRSKI